MRYIEPLYRMVRGLEERLRGFEDGRYRVFEQNADGAVERTEESKAQLKKQIDELEAIIEQMKAETHPGR